MVIWFRGVKGPALSRGMRVSPARLHGIQSVLDSYLIICLQPAYLSGHTTKGKPDTHGNLRVPEHKAHRRNHCALELHTDVLSSFFPLVYGRGRSSAKQNRRNTCHYSLSLCKRGTLDKDSGILSRGCSGLGKRQINTTDYPELPVTR